MDHHQYEKLTFSQEVISAHFVGPSGEPVERLIEVRRNPITFRTCRITLSRSQEKEAGTDAMPPPPPDVTRTSICPFCEPQLQTMTPRLCADTFSKQRLQVGGSKLFPNLFPYGSYSAVSLIDANHFVEIGKASWSSYRDSFENSIQYLHEILAKDPKAVYMAITQNHLPSAGGSLVHPHLQVNADRLPSNHQRFLQKRCAAYFRRNRSLLLSDYLARERENASRYIGATGEWEWLAAFAPEGFFEIWGILPGVTSFEALLDDHLTGLAQGVMNTQRLYRSLNRNGYNLGILVMATPASRLELRVVLMVRSNYAPWVRNDHTGFEVMLGDMATFTSPETTAKEARRFW